MAEKDSSLIPVSLSSCPVPGGERPNIPAPGVDPVGDGLLRAPAPIPGGDRPDIPAPGVLLVGSGLPHNPSTIMGGVPAPGIDSDRGGLPGACDSLLPTPRPVAAREIPNIPAPAADLDCDKGGLLGASGGLPRTPGPFGGGGRSASKVADGEHSYKPTPQPTASRLAHAGDAQCSKTTASVAKRGVLASSGNRVASCAGGSEDRISALPDDLILFVLQRLPSKEAVKTCVLSHRWQSIWTHMKRLVLSESEAQSLKGGEFHAVMANTLSRRGNEELHELRVSVIRRPEMAGLGLWLPTAATLVSGEFGLLILRSRPSDQFVPFVLEVPAFEKARKVVLYASFNEVRLPIGTFRKLTQLKLVGAKFTEEGANPGEVVSNCCRVLKLLEFASLWNLQSLILHHDILVEIRLGWIEELSMLDIEAPNLRCLSVIECFAFPEDSGDVSLNLPKLTKMDWRTSCPSEVMVPSPKYLDKFCLAVDFLENAQCITKNFRTVGSLELVIKDQDIEAAKKKIEESHLPNHSELRIIIQEDGHQFGPEMDIRDA